jgi:hypothetical protein
MEKFFNALYAFGIAANTSLIGVNLLGFDNIKGAGFNFICGILCWIGYYRTKQDGNERRN